MIIKGVLIGGAAFLFIYPLQWWMSFKHQAVFRVITRNGKYIKKWGAKPKTIKGVHYWQLRVPFKKKVIVPSPPKDAIELTKNGRYYAEANITEQNPTEPVWLIDTNEEYGAFEPIGTQERALHVQMMEDAEQHRKKSIGELLIQAAPYMSIVILAALLLVFFEDVVAPSQKIMATASSMNDRMERITENQRQITNDLARILEVSDIEITQRIPPERTTKAVEELSG